MLEEETQSRRARRHRKRAAPRRLFPAALAGFAIISLVTLFPLRGLLESLPAVRFLAALTLFLIPGFTLSTLFHGRRLAESLPLALVLSTGVFGLLALPLVLLNASTSVYAAACGVLVSISVAAAFIWEPAKVERNGGEESAVALWAPFLIGTGVLAHAARLPVSSPIEDYWLYLSKVRDALELGGLAAGLGGFTRLDVNGWLPEQAALSLVSGVDPGEMIRGYLAPVLATAALLSLYALALALLRSESAALTVGSLSALLLILGFSSTTFGSQAAPGSEFVSRITEDKFLVRYVFLPATLALMISYAQDRRLRSLGLFLLACLATIVVHPLGLVFIGTVAAGFGAVHLAVRLGDSEARKSVGGIWGVLLLLGVPPALYLLVTGSNLLSRLDSTDPELASSLIDTWQYEERLLQLGDDSYIVNPSLLMDPVIIAAYLPGAAFLLWKRRLPGAQMLLGTLLLVPALAFMPPVATFTGDAIGPWLLHRLTWPLLLAALLTTGWMLYEILGLASSGLARLRGLRHAAPLLPTILFICLLAAAAPLAMTGLRSIDNAGEEEQNEAYCRDPAFAWLRGAVSEPAGMLAPRKENICLLAQIPHAQTVGGRRNASEQARRDLDHFYETATVFDIPSLRILQRYDIRYVLLPKDSPLRAQLDHLPGFSRLNAPGNRYEIYEVNPGQAEATQAVRAGTFANRGEWGSAAAEYRKTLSGNEDERFLARLGIGQAYAEAERFGRAASQYRQALEIDPESHLVHELLANAHEATGNRDQAQSELGEAVKLDPENVELRMRYAELLADSDAAASADQYREVVRLYPDTPDYRVQLGEQLIRAGNDEEAEREFERAIESNPLSAETHSGIGAAYLNAGRLHEAAPSFERATEIDPRDQIYAFQLGFTNYQLFTINRDGEYFELARERLEHATELEPAPNEADLTAAAFLTLGDLYYARDMKEEAIRAYEEVQKIEPDSQRAAQRLKELRDG